jgi:hypothetical protein
MRQAIVLLTLILLLGAGMPSSLEGDWVLVEQRYGRGARNIFDNETPVRLSIRTGTGQPSVMIRTGDRSALPWPAFVSPRGPGELELESRSVDAVAGVIYARFRMVSPEDPAFVYRVEEEYHLTPDGDGLEGTMTVWFERDGEPRGSFVLTSRFERSP